MDVLEVVRTIDGGVTVSVMIVMFWWLRRDVLANIDRMWNMIERLTNGYVAQKKDK